MILFQNRLFQRKRRKLNRSINFEGRKYSKQRNSKLIFTSACEDEKLTPVPSSKIKIIRNKNNRTISQKKEKLFRSRAASLNNSFSPIIFTTPGNTGFCAHPELSLMHIIPEQRRQYNNFLTCDSITNTKTNNSRESINSSKELTEEPRIENVIHKDLIITYENRIKDLQKTINDKDSTIEWMKKTTQFTKDLKLKYYRLRQENQVLYIHIKNLYKKLMMVNKVKQEQIHTQLDPNNQESFDSSTEVALSPYRNHMNKMESFASSSCSKRTKLDILVENYNEICKKYTDLLSNVNNFKDKIQSLTNAKESLGNEIKNLTAQNISLKNEIESLKKEKAEKNQDIFDHTPKFHNENVEKWFANKQPANKSKKMSDTSLILRKPEIKQRMYSKKPSMLKAQNSRITESSGGVQINVSSLCDMKNKTFKEQPHLNPISQRGSDKSVASNKSSQILYEKKGSIRLKKEQIIKQNIVQK